MLCDFGVSMSIEDITICTMEYAVYYFEGTYHDLEGHLNVTHYLSNYAVILETCIRKHLKDDSHYIKEYFINEIYSVERFRK